jgi:rRNA maturation protein Nop10
MEKNNPAKIIYRGWIPPSQKYPEGREYFIGGDIIPEPPAEVEKPSGRPAFNNCLKAGEACPRCGAISFLAVEKCDICGQKTAFPKKRTTAPARLSLEEFEAAKRSANKLNRELLLIWFDKRQSARREKLEAEIKKLRQALENNIHLALRFNPKVFLNS